MVHADPEEWFPAGEEVHLLLVSKYCWVEPTAAPETVGSVAGDVLFVQFLVEWRPQDQRDKGCGRGSNQCWHRGIDKASNCVARLWCDISTWLPPLVLWGWPYDCTLTQQDLVCPCVLSQTMCSPHLASSQGIPSQKPCTFCSKPAIQHDPTTPQDTSVVCHNGQAQEVSCSSDLHNRMQRRVKVSGPHVSPVPLPTIAGSACVQLHELCTLRFSGCLCDAVPGWCMTAQHHMVANLTKN